MSLSIHVATLKTICIRNHDTNFKEPLTASLIALIIVASLFGYYFIQTSAVIQSQSSMISSQSSVISGLGLNITGANGKITNQTEEIASLSSLLGLQVTTLLVSNQQYNISAGSAERIAIYNATTAGYLQITGFSNQTNSFVVVCEHQSYCGFSNATAPVFVANFGPLASIQAPFSPGTVYMFLEAGTVDTNFNSVLVTAYT